MKKEPLLLIDGCWGIKIPSMFEEISFMSSMQVTNLTEEDRLELRKGADSPFYWEVWESVLLHSQVILHSTEYYLHQDGDLWLVPKGTVWNEERGSFEEETP